MDAEFSEARSMLGAAYSLDIRGLPMSPGNSGSARIARACFTQVLPKPGAYAVRCEGETVEQPGVLTVEEDYLSLTVAECKGIRTVVFQ
jgi:hypothetical protein